MATLSATMRIGKDNYQRPKSTMQDKLTDADIKELLATYVLVDDIFKVPIGSHLRYYTMKDGKKVFRMGGLLNNKDNADKFIVLSNGRLTWTVQTKSSEFYRKMSVEEIREEYENTIREKDAKIKKLREKLNKYIDIATKYEEVIKRMGGDTSRSSGKRSSERR